VLLNAESKGETYPSFWAFWSDPLLLEDMKEGGNKMTSNLSLLFFELAELSEQPFVLGPN